MYHFPHTELQLGGNAHTDCQQDHPLYESDDFIKIKACVC